MKSKVTIMLASLLIFGACSTGTYVTRTYEDDIYFTPGDIVLPTVSDDLENKTQNQPQADNAAKVGDQQVIISQSETYQDGSKGLKNYIFQDNGQGDYLRADMDALDEFDLVASDTTVVGDEEDYQYIINNYYETDDLGYAYRINRFHRPFFYGSFGLNSWYWNDWYWNDWYSPYYYGGWGYSPYYSSWYWDFPYYSWYSPYYYGGWGWPYYYGGYYYPYYSYHHWGGYHGGGFYNSDDYHYGQRRGSYSTVADGRSGSYSSTISRSRDTGLKSGSAESREYSSAREGLTSRRDRSIDGNPQETKSATLTEKRRAVEANSNQRDISTNRPSEGTGSQALQSISGNRGNSTVIRNNEPSTTSRVYRSGTTTQQRTYVPSYSKPRTVTRSTYNSTNGNTYNRANTNNSSAPATVNRSSSNYSKPQSNSSGSVRNTYQSGSSYSRGSSSSSNRSSNSSYNRSSSSYSQPRSSGSSYNSGGARSYSSGSSGSYSGSSGSSSGGGGGSRSGSSSGRR